MSTAEERVETGDFGSFASSAILNVVLLVIVLVAFWILKSMRSNKYFFFPQYYDSLDKGSTELPPPGKSPWAFCASVLRFPEDRIMAMRGLDSVMYLRVLKLMLQIFALFIPLGCGLLLPLNATADGGETGIPSISLSNVPRKSARMWAHVVVAVIFNILAGWLMYRTYQGYLDLRIYWMKQDKPRNYTVMFKGIPRTQLSPFQYFSQLFPNEVVSAHYGLENKIIRDLIQKRKDSVKKLEYSRLALENTGIRPTHKLKPIIGPKVDSINHYEQEINTLNGQIDLQYQKFLAQPKYTHVGFATFHTIPSAAIKAQLVMDRNINGLKSLAAPEAEDVYWEKLGRTRTISSVTRGLTWALIFALIFLWSIPIVFIQGIANLENLTKLSAFSWLDTVLGWSPVVKGLIQQFLPALFTIIFLAVLPDIIKAIVKFKGVYTQSEVNRGLFKIYFLFLLFNVFLVSLWAGGIFSVLGDLVDQSGWELLNFLATGVASQSIFFINYLIVFALFKYPLNVIRIGDFIKAVLKRKGCKSEEERRDVQRAKEFDFGSSSAVDVLIFSIGLTYAVMSPFILPFVLLFFGISYLIAKYMVVYVRKPEWDSGGVMWPLIFNRMIVAMLISQVTLIGIFVLNSFPGAAVIAPLPFATLIFSSWAHYKFDNKSEHCPYLEYPTISNGLPFADTYEDPLITECTGANQSDIEGGKKVLPLPDPTQPPTASPASR